MKQPYSAESARFLKVMEGLKDLPLFRSQLPPGFDAKRIDPAFLPNTPIEEIELPTRAIKRLPRLGIQTLGQLMARPPG